MSREPTQSELKGVVGGSLSLNVLSGVFYNFQIYLFFNFFLSFYPKYPLHIYYAFQLGASNGIAMGANEQVSVSLAFSGVFSVGLFAFSSCDFLVFVLSHILFYYYHLESWLYSNNRQSRVDPDWRGHWQELVRSRKMGNHNHTILCDRKISIFTKGKEPNINCKYYLYVTSIYNTIKIYADLNMKHFCRVSKQVE